jgi:hypothetical protein
MTPNAFISATLKRPRRKSCPQTLKLWWSTRQSRIHAWFTAEEKISLFHHTQSAIDISSQLLLIKFAIIVVDSSNKIDDIGIKATIASTTACI